MNLSRQARLMTGLSLLAVPTVMYGGATLLGILTRGGAGLQPGGLTLDETQWALFRAGHAHAGVWMILAIVIQVLLDSAALSAGVKWLTRIVAPLAAVTMSAGFFALALTGTAWAIYLGATMLLLVAVLTGIGLLRARGDV